MDPATRLRIVDAALRSDAGLHVGTAASACGCSLKSIRRDLDTLRRTVGPIDCRMIQTDGNAVRRSWRHWFAE